MRSAEAGKNVQALIAGKVKGPVTFSAAPSPASAGGQFRLYTRAADAIEAATGVELGRTIDVRG